MLCGLAGPLSAQSPIAGSAAQAAPAAPAPPTPQVEPPLDMGSVLGRANADQRFAADVIERAGESPGSDAALQARLARIAGSVTAPALWIKPIQLRSLPVDRLKSLDRHWAFESRRFEQWQDDLDQSGQHYASDATELVQRRNAWAALQASHQAFPPVVLARAAAVIADLDRAEQALADPVARQIAMGERALSVDTRIKAGHRVVTDAIADYDARLLRLDVPPLWDVQPRGHDRGALASIQEGLQIEAAFATEYALDSGRSGPIHVLNMVLLPLLLWLYFGTRRLVRNHQVAPGTARVLSRPFSCWLLLVMISILALEPDAPLLSQQIAMVLALIPVLRLLPPEGKRLLGLWPYVTSVLYLLAHVGFLFLAGAMVYRIYWLALAALGLAGTLWLLWRARRGGHAQATGRIGAALRAAARISVVVFAVALVANVVGNTSLAEMLTMAVINSAYFGLLLYAGWNVASRLLQLWLQRASAHPPAQRAHDHARSFVGLATRLLTTAAIAGWMVYALDAFRLFRPLYELVSRVLSYTWSLGEIQLSLGHVVAFLVSILLAFWLARTIRVLLEDEVVPRTRVSRGVGTSMAALAYYVILLLGLLAALSAAGFKSTQLALVFGALGVGVGFGLQNIVNNFVSGLVLVFERPFQPGDVIEVAGTTGRVHDVGLRAARLTTFEGANVIVPNGLLLSGQLTNWTLLDRNRRIDVTVCVAYGSVPGQVKDLLQETTAGVEGIARVPAPIVLFMDMGTSALEFSVRAWTNEFDDWLLIRSELVTRLHAALAEAGIEVPFPQQDVHIRSIDPGIQTTIPGSATDGTAAGNQA